MYCAPEVAATMTARLTNCGPTRCATAQRRRVDQGSPALRTPQHQIRDAVVDLGGRTVSITHPGCGHTRHDLIVEHDGPVSVSKSPAIR